MTGHDAAGHAIQAIIDRLTGDPRVPPTPVDSLPEPWRTIYLRLKPAGNVEEAAERIYHATLDLPGASDLCHDLCHALPPRHAFSAYPSLLQAAARHPGVDWLWPSWIPLGLLTILAAAPGAGKSLLALDLARRLIAGLPLPDGAPPFGTEGGPAFGTEGGPVALRAHHRVLIVDAEGTLNLLDERARAWDIDRHRLFVMDPISAHRPIDLATRAYQEHLTTMCLNIQPYLVIVDSLAAVTSSSEASLESARQLLAFLSGLAERMEMALLLIHHLRKRPYVSTRQPVRPAADDLRGSSHLSAAARSILALSLAAMRDGEPDPNGPRRLEVVKTNLCAYPAPLYVHLEGDGSGVPTLRYAALPEAGPLALTAVDRCARWLLDHLAAHGPSRPRDVVPAARVAGFSRPTLYRARRILAEEIVDENPQPRSPYNRWALATPLAQPPV